MNIRSKNWWKLLLIVLCAVITRVLMLQLLPLSPTFELPLSRISQTIGMIPSAGFVITMCYLVIGAVLLSLQESIPGSRLSRVLTFILSYSAFWFVAVLETVPALGKPLGAEILVGLADIVPLAVIGILIGLWTPRNDRRGSISSLSQNMAGVIIVALMYFAGRYFLYAVVRVNSGYSVREGATFAWTLAMGLAAGLMYVLLRSGIKGVNPLQKGLWFGIVAFGMVWALSNFFMPIVFDMSFIDFDPPILNYVWRTTVDVLFVTAGAWLAEVIRKKEPGNQVVNERRIRKPLDV